MDLSDYGRWTERDMNLCGYGGASRTVWNYGETVSALRCVCDMNSVLEKFREHIYDDDDCLSIFYQSQGVYQHRLLTSGSPF